MAMLLEDHGLIGDMQSAALRQRQVGNFPQACSRLTLILAACAIATGEAGR